MKKAEKQIDDTQTAKKICKDILHHRHRLDICSFLKWFMIKPIWRIPVVENCF
jgi:hypothetical protein